MFSAPLNDDDELCRIKVPIGTVGDVARCLETNTTKTPAVSVSQDALVTGVFHLLCAVGVTDASGYIPRMLSTPASVEMGGSWTPPCGFCCCCCCCCCGGC